MNEDLIVLAAEVEAAYAAHFVFEHRVHDGWTMLAGQKTA